eukprot:s466_g18.t1
MYAPMWVIRVQDVLKMTGRFPPHQELKQQGLLRVRERMNPWSWAIFVSQPWLGRNHPDPNGEQLKVLQEILQNLISRKTKVEHNTTAQFFLKGRSLTKAECSDLHNAFVWLDYWCVPQMIHSAECSREEQLQHIFSIPYYVDACQVFVALVPRSCHETGEPCGEATWIQRGWCRTEMWCKLLSEASDIPIMLVTSGDSVEFATPRWTLNTVHSGQFALEEDRYACGQVVQTALEHKLSQLRRRGDLDRLRLFLALFEDLMGLPARQRSLQEFLSDFAFGSLDACRGKLGVGPVACATLAGDCEMIRTLVSAQASLQTRTRADEVMGVMPGSTPLHLACQFRSGYLEPIKTLLQLRADVHAARGGTPAPLNFCQRAASIELLV